MQTLKLHFLKSAITSVMLLFSPLVTATGFGWYAGFFDYESFIRDYPNKIAGEVSRIDQEMTGDDTYLGRETDWAILDYLELNSDSYSYARPEVDNGELLWHQAMMSNVRLVLNDFPSSHIRHLSTGRLFVSVGNIKTCKPEFDGLIHGACRTCVLFTNDEVQSVYWDMTRVMNKKPKFLDEIYKEEFLRLRNIFKEAALKDKGVYIYGHD